MSPFWEEGLSLRLRQAEDGRPQEFHWQWRWHRITHVLHHWRVHTDWWTDREIWRDYWDVATDSGLLCTLYRDLLDDGEDDEEGQALPGGEAPPEPDQARPWPSEARLEVSEAHPWPSEAQPKTGEARLKVSEAHPWYLERVYE